MKELDVKQQRLNMCLEFREMANDDPIFISRRSWAMWVYVYSPETKQQLSQKKTPQSQRPGLECNKRACASCSTLRA